MGVEYRSVAVDTYALLAMALDQLGEKARQILLSIRRRDVEGLITSLAAYEFALH